MTALPFHQVTGRIELPLLGEADAPWVAALLDEVEAAVGLPWHALVERLDRLPARTRPARHAAVLQAIRATLSGTPRGAVAPTRLRRALFGDPALTEAERAQRLAALAAIHALTVEELERSLWGDLPAERIVTLPRGRPAPMDIAAAANLALIQRALTRCHQLRLWLRGNAGAIVRTAAVRGLLTTARRVGDAVELDVSGPLALFHRTTVYGRALGSLIPHLAWCEHFVLDARCDLGRGIGVLQLRPPLLVTPSRPPRRYDSGVEARFARELARLAPDWRLSREPTAIDAGRRLVFPDFLLEHREDLQQRWWVEIVGYWTPGYLQTKLASYRAADLPNVILCIDDRRAIEDGALPRDARVVRYRNHVRAEDVLAIIAPGAARPA